MNLNNNQTDKEFNSKKVLEIMNELVECNKKKNEYLDMDEMYKAIEDALESEEYLSEKEKYIEKCVNELKPEINKELKRLGLIDDDGNPTQLGVCHKEWEITKRLMKEKFDLDWKSPAELQPWINFD